MRRLVPSLLLLFAACAEPPGAGTRIITACLRGDPAACDTRSRSEQARLDADAILIGIQLSALREAAVRTP